MAQASPRDIYSREEGGPIHEDLLDEIFQISPEDTPFYSSIGDTSAGNVIHNWTTRELPTRGSSPVQEGGSFSSNWDAARFPTRVSNITQIIRRLPQVSGTAQAVSTAGVTDLMSDQVDHYLRDWKNEAEYSLIRNTMTTGSSHDSSPRQLGGFYNKVTDNSFNYATGATLGVDTFRAGAKAIWQDGGNPAMCLVGTQLKEDIGAQTAGNTKYIFAEDKRIVGVVDIFEHDYGVTEFHLCRDVRDAAASTRDALIYDPEFFAKAWLRRPSVRMLPEGNGDSVEAAIIGELTLEYGNEKAAGRLNFQV